MRYNQKYCAARMSNIPIHILIAEKVLGYKLPKNAEVHHFDENKQNNLHTNLVICENRSYHVLLHVRQNIVRHGGDPAIHKYCNKCSTLKDRKDFRRNSTAFDGLQSICGDCRKKYY